MFVKRVDKFEMNMVLNLHRPRTEFGILNYSKVDFLY